MCGLCGVINFAAGAQVELAVLQNMTRTMTHRGPDGEGYYLDGPIGLGHRRLAIIDLETGQQPIANEDRSLWIVCNGEIYNYPELREALEKKGHQFSTRSDTEVVLHAFEEYGTNCLMKINGMFALAIWDKRRRRLWLARDRVGIKPLYYAEAPGHFLFASELRAIMAHPAVDRHLDFVGLQQYLAFEYVPAPRTIFEGVKKLPPGHFLVWKDRHIRLERYWDMAFDPGEDGPGTNLQASIVELRTKLMEAVRQEMVADVPLGVLLSGGIDSSTVAAMMVQTSPRPMRSFSIAFDDPSFDESRYARLAARSLGTQHQEVTLTVAKMLELVPLLGDILDEPLGDSSIIPTYFLSNCARRQVKVVLGGDGGDELFGGYSTLQAHRLAGFVRHLVPERLRSRALPAATRLLPVSFDNISFDFKIRRFLAGLELPAPRRHHFWMGSFTADERRLLSESWEARYDHEVEQVIDNHIKASQAKDLLDQILYLDMKLYLEGDILCKVDRASMANSLEVRVPLLHSSLLDFAARLPHSLKLHGLTTKYLLRQAMKGLLPQAISRRGKKGFNMPVAKWLIGPLRPIVEEMLSSARLKRQGLFKPAYVRTLWQDHLDRRQDNRKLLWTLLMFELWYDKWAS